MGYFREGNEDYVIIPIQIRANARVDIRIPRDLTAKEAQRVTAVILALADAGEAAQLASPSPGYEAKRSEPKPLEPQPTEDNGR